MTVRKRDMIRSLAQQIIGAAFRPSDDNISVILPGLLLSSAAAAQDPSNLHRYGVTHVLNVGGSLPPEIIAQRSPRPPPQLQQGRTSLDAKSFQKRMLPGQRVFGSQSIPKERRAQAIVPTSVPVVGTSRQSKRTPQIAYRYIDILDTPWSDIAHHFGHSAKFIHDARQSGGVVLVHCQAGVSRSPTVIANYLMTHQNASLEQALTHLKRRRSIVAPNDGFLQQLRAQEKKLLSKGSLARSPKPLRLSP